MDDPPHGHAWPWAAYAKAASVVQLYCTYTSSISGRGPTEAHAAGPLAADSTAQARPPAQLTRQPAALTNSTAWSWAAYAKAASVVQLYRHARAPADGSTGAGHPRRTRQQHTPLVCRLPCGGPLRALGTTAVLGGRQRLHQPGPGEVGAHRMDRGPRLPGRIKVVNTNIAQRAANRSAAVHNSPLQNSGSLFSDLRAAAQWCPTARCKEHVSRCSASGSFDSGTRYQIGMPDTVEWLCT